MLYTRTTNVTVEIDAKTMKRLGIARDTLSEQANGIVMAVDGSSHMKGRVAAR